MSESTASSKKGWRSRKLRWPRRVVYVLLALQTVVIGWKVAVYSQRFPSHYLTTPLSHSLAIVDSRGNELRHEVAASGVRNDWVALEDISPHVVNATLASEDQNFYRHEGVDWPAIARAMWLNVRSRSASYGGSTITMQLTRALTGSKRSALGKINQALLAERLEREIGKNEILEQYFNRIYYGNGAWGIEQAANLYFDKSAKELSLGEATALVVIPRGPTRYNPYTRKSELLRRRRHILSLMTEMGMISQARADEAHRIPLAFKENRPEFLAPHFAEYVKKQLPQRFQLGARIETTLDYGLQKKIEVAVKRHTDRLTSRNLTQAAVVVIRNSDGAIMAMVGSSDYKDKSNNGNFNGATARLRPGSTLKPFVYATAMERGDTASSIAYDVILPGESHQFYTKDVKSHGFARYRESLAGSYNLSAVHVMQRVGRESVLDKLRRAGLAETLNKPDEEYDDGLAIGHAEVTLLDLTAAFTTFGNGGRPIKPRAIVNAISHDGELFSQPVTRRDRVFSEDISYLLFDILSDPDARKPMFGDAVPMNLPFKVALKTGTTKAYTDLWAVGTTKEYTVGVWGGNFSGQPTHQVMSVVGATPLLRAVFVAVAARYGDPTAPFRPPSVVEAEVCPVSGARPGPHCPHRKRELFAAHTMPQHTCSWHQHACGRDYLVLPEELRPWARAVGRWSEPDCAEIAAEDDKRLRIVSPASGAKYILEPFRDLEAQKPHLRALGVGSSGARWTIDGVPAKEWLPRPGTFTIRVESGERTDEIKISYSE